MRLLQVAPPTLARRARRAVAWFLGVSVLIEVAAALVPAQAAPAAGTSAVVLNDDDGGSALFGSAGLHPGRIDTACVALSAEGPADPDGEVRLSADVGEDGLAPYLLMTVERGTVGSFGNCASFTGTPVWAGTLAEFPRSAGDGIPTGWRPADLSRAVYRFTVTVLDDARAQQLAASATLIWSLDGEAVRPEPQPQPEPEPQPQPRPRPDVQPQPPAPSPPGVLPGDLPEPPQPPPPAPEAGPAAQSAGTAAESPRAVATASPPQAPAAVDGTPQVPGTRLADGAAPSREDVVEAPPLQTGRSLADRLLAASLSLLHDAHSPLLPAVLTALGAPSRVRPGRPEDSGGAAGPGSAEASPAS